MKKLIAVAALALMSSAAMATPTWWFNYGCTDIVPGGDYSYNSKAWQIPDQKMAAGVNAGSQAFTETSAADGWGVSEYNPGQPGKVDGDRAFEVKDSSAGQQIWSNANALYTSGAACPGMTMTFRIKGESTGYAEGSSGKIMEAAMWWLAGSAGQTRLKMGKYQGQIWLQDDRAPSPKWIGRIDDGFHTFWKTMSISGSTYHHTIYFDNQLIYEYDSARTDLNSRFNWGSLEGSGQNSYWLDDFAFTYDGAFAPTSADGLALARSIQGLAPVPEPCSLLALGSGLIGLMGVIRRKIR